MARGSVTHALKRARAHTHTRGCDHLALLAADVGVSLKAVVLEWERVRARVSTCACACLRAINPNKGKDPISWNQIALISVHVLSKIK